MNIVEQRKPIKSKHINLTKHAYERYTLRVSNDSKERACQWFASALMQATFEHTQKGGNEVYVFKNYRIIIDKHLTIITVIDTEDDNWEGIKEAREQIETYIKGKLKRTVTPLFTKLDRIDISIHEAHISMIKTRNPKTKDIINKNIIELERNKSLLLNSIEGVKKTAHKYYIELKDIHKRLKD
ncbi:hypothetical protein qdsa001_189 [Staphylococcus phage qdsa001]|nr:hypothetical protein qdsa001_189 [Staphylococcus phage qdsa001]QXV86202.1 hypothetical protein [Staphylococcus phage SAPYZU_15]UVD42371.1 hypothetical protein [Staphylococcus phage vB_SauM-V1SA19]